MTGQGENGLLLVPFPVVIPTPYWVLRSTQMTRPCEE
jgi:hypothetical protein